MKSAKVLVIHGDKSARIQFLQYLRLYEGESLEAGGEAGLSRLIREISPDIVVYHSPPEGGRPDDSAAADRRGETAASGTGGGWAPDRQDRRGNEGKPYSEWVLALAQRHSGGTHGAPTRFAARGFQRGHEPLTPRELQVLELIEQGLTNREIAERLRLKETTIKSYNNTIFSKLLAKNRIQAVINARELGLVPERRGREDPGPAPGGISGR